MAPITVGDSLPDGTLAWFDENDQMQQVSIHSLAKGKKVILFGVPGAFTPTCSMKHVPGFITSADELKSKGVDEILLISVNDPFVMKAWAKTYPENKHVKFLADGSGTYTHALGLELDLSEKGLGIRSRRFALLADDLKVKAAERHSGIGELLEILGSIINGFVLPMKEEHKLFLVRALIPLHKPKSVGHYHQQLSYCITQFVEKDYKLADTVIRGLLKYWPVTNCQKEVLFLGELEEVLDATQPAEFQKCMVPLFKQIGRCLTSSHFQVAERAIFLWNNDHIVGLIAQNRNAIFPIIFEKLEKNMQSHWNQAVHGLTANVRKMFLEMDNELFEECQQQYAEKEAKARALEEQRETAWRRLEAAVGAMSGNEDMVLAS